MTVWRVSMLNWERYKLIYCPDCVVYNKGPINRRDFLKQRRRIYAGHLKVRSQQNYEASTMKISPILEQLIASRDFTMSSPRQALWTVGTVGMEGYARVQGYYDYSRKREHHIWQMVETTKDLEAGSRKVRRLCNAQSVIVFRFILAGADGTDANREREEREATEVARKLLPAIRAKLRKEDKLSVNGPGIMTAVIRAEQSGAELVAQRVKQVVEETAVRVGMRNREIKVTLTHSSLTFASKINTSTSTASVQPVEVAVEDPASEEQE
jgi:hypothetical protein